MWIDEKMEELRKNPKSEWTEDDWEAWNYCQQTAYEYGYYDED